MGTQYLLIICIKKRRRSRLSRVRSANSGRLFWISDLEPPKNIAKSFYFNIDNVFIRSARICSTTASIKTSDLSTSEKLGST